VFGVDAVAADRYLADAFALEDCEVCVIPYAELESLSSRIQALHRLVYRLLSREIARKQEMMFVLGSMRADERLATFLVNLSNRLDARGLSSSDFVLRMTREEIGSFLGLCVETVSRLFSRMHRDGVLAIDGKHVCITDGDRLKGMVGH
jgi:CRP/FNR family transcriptional regulator